MRLITMNTSNFDSDTIYKESAKVIIVYSLEFSKRGSGGGYNRGSSNVGTRPSSLVNVLLSYPDSGILLISGFGCSLTAPSMKNMVEKNRIEPRRKYKSGTRVN